MSEEKKTPKQWVTKTINFLGLNRPISFLKGMLIGIICGALIFGSVERGIKKRIAEIFHNSKQAIEETFNKIFLGKTEVAFIDAILNETSEKAELIVMEQTIEISSTITKSGFANWDIFSKTKTITYPGKGIYTLSLKQIQPEDIEVDYKMKTITVSVPHVKFASCEMDVNKIVFEDTEKGLLAFGDIKLTSEQYNEIEVTVKKQMEDRLTQEDMLQMADNYGCVVLYKWLQPIVNNISADFYVIINYKD